MPASREEVFASISDVLVEALGVDAEEVTDEAVLETDLGAESIDFLDIVFRLEKTFGFKIQKNELFPDEILNNPDYVDGDRITPTGIQKLQEAMPHADFTEFDKNPLVSKIPDLFTVATIVNFVSAKLGEGSAEGATA